MPERIIPYEPGTDPLAAEHVFLRRDEFLKLWRNAHPGELKPKTAQSLGFVASAYYRIDLSKTDLANAATGTIGAVDVDGRLVISGVPANESLIPLPWHDLPVATATLDGQPATLVPIPKGKPGQLGLLLKQQPTENNALRVLDVRLRVPVERVGSSSGTLQLPFLPVATGRLTLQLPTDEMTLEVNGQSNTFRSRIEADVRILEIPLISSGSLKVHWSPRQAAGGMTELVHAEAATVVTLEDAGLRLSAGYAFRVRQGAVRSLRFSLSDGLRITRVEGADVGGWEVADDENERTSAGRTLTVFLRREITDQVAIRLELFRDIVVKESTQPITVGDFGPIGVTREIGMIAFSADSQFQVRPLETDGLRRIEPDRFRDSVETANSKRNAQAPVRPLDFAWQYSTRPFTLKVSASRRTTQLTGETKHAVQIERHKTRINTLMSIEIAGAPQSTLRLYLPGNFLVYDVTAEGLSDWQVVRVPEGGQDLVLDYGEPISGATAVALAGAVPRTPEKRELELDLPFLLDVERNRVEAAIWSGAQDTLRITEADGWQSVPVRELSETVRTRLARLPQFGLVSTESEPDVIHIEVTPATPRLSGNSLVVTTVSNTSVGYNLALEWQVTQAAADVFEFVLPSQLDSAIDFVTPGIRETSHESLADQTTRWTVTLHEAVENSFLLLATAVVPHPADGHLSVPTVQFVASPAEQASDTEALETQQHYVVVVNQSTQQVTAANENALNLVAVEDLPIKFHPELLRQALAVGKRISAAAVTFTLRDVGQLVGAPASVNLADMTTVLARDGSWRTAAVYLVKNRSRQFLAITLPEKARALSVFVADQASRLVQTEIDGKPASLIALPPTSQADVSFPVRVVLTGRLEGGRFHRGPQLMRRPIRFPVPQVVSYESNAEWGTPVAKTVWTVHLPDDLDVDVATGPEVNLSRVRDGIAEIYQQSVLLGDAAELFQVLEGQYSSRVKTRALDNLKQLETTLHSGAYSWANRGESPEMERLQAQADQVRLQIEQLKQPAEGAEAPQGVQPPAGRLSDIRSHLSANTAILNDFNEEKLNVDREPGRELKRFAVVDENRSKMGLADKPDAGKKSLTKSAPVQDRAARQEQSKQNLRQLVEQLEEKESRKQVEMEVANTPMQRQAGSPQATPPHSMDQRTDQVGRAMGGAGGGLADQQHDGQLQSEVPVWSRAGGLSLPIDIPTSGQRLVFEKAGGDPKLELLVRPHRSLEWLFGIGWAIAWLTVAGWIAASLSRAAGRQRFWRSLSLLLLVAGTLGFFLVTGPLQLVSLVAFAVGLLILSIRRSRQQPSGSVTA
mgnify:CR=1 FL=1